MVFFYHYGGVEIINEMTLKHYQGDFFACLNQMTSELVSTNFCSGALLKSHNLPSHPLLKPCKLSISYATAP